MITKTMTFYRAFNSGRMDVDMCPVLKGNRRLQIGLHYHQQPPTIKMVTLNFTSSLNAGN